MSKNDTSINENNSHNILDSILWARETFEKEGCELIINNGDFIDSDTIDAESNYIISQVYKNNKQKEILLCGNHELKDKDAKYTSLNILDNYPNIEVNNKLKTKKIGDTTLIFQPYTNKEEDIAKLLKKLDTIEGKKILFSHLTYRNVPNVYMSDKIKGEIDYNTVADKVDLIFNGHIHKALESDKYVQIGNLAGLNFSDDYDVHRPGIIILDTDTLEWRRIENPKTILFIKTNYANIDLGDELSRAYLRIECPVTKLKETQEQIEKLGITRYKLKLLSEAKDAANSEDKKDFNLYSDPASALRDFIKVETGVYTTEQLNDFINRYYENQKVNSQEEN